MRQELVEVAEEPEDLLGLRLPLLPDDPDLVPLLVLYVVLVRELDELRPLIDDQPTAYVCRGYACDRPVTDADTLSEQLENAAKAGAVATA